MPTPEPQKSPLSPLLSLGLNMATGMALFSFLGYALDRKRGGGMAFTLTGMFLGLMYGFYETWKLIRQIQRQDDDKKKGGPAKPID